MLPGLPYDPFNAPQQATETAARLLANELKRLGWRTEVRVASQGRTYLVLVPGARIGPIEVRVRDTFYTWPSPRAEYGHCEHTLWGDHTAAAARIAELAATW